jgi:hypothetical protein
MFAWDFFTKETFPFQHVITNWNDGDKARMGINA